MSQISQNTLPYKLTELALYTNFFKAIFLQNIVKNLERQEVRDWLQNTREILEGERKVHKNNQPTQKQEFISTKSEHI